MAGLFIYQIHRFAFTLQYKIVTYKTQIISNTSTKTHEKFSFHTDAVFACFDKLRAGK